MAFDECPLIPVSVMPASAVARTIRWAGSFWSMRLRMASSSRGTMSLASSKARPTTTFAITVGRPRKWIFLAMPSEASVSENPKEMIRQVAATAPVMPKNKPRYVMGVGTPPQLLKMVGLGMDMFDCVMPPVCTTCNVFTPMVLNLKNERFYMILILSLADTIPVRTLAAPTFAISSRRRNYRGTLLSIHNTHFFLDLMAQAKAHIEAVTPVERCVDWAV